MPYAQTKQGFGANGRLTTSAQQTIATEIQGVPNGIRRLRIAASVYAINALSNDEIARSYSRLVAWQGNAPTDADNAGLDPESAYYGDTALPGRALLDVLIPANRPFVQTCDFLLDPNTSLWLYMGGIRQTSTGAQLTGIISLQVADVNVRNDNGGYIAR